VVTVLDECREQGIKVAPPNVNMSEFKFTISDDDVIVYGLGAIKGAGEGAIESIINSRNHHGRFKDLQDFCNRIDLRKANKRVLETLVRSGALDELGINRATLLNAIPEATKAADQFSKAQAAGQDDLFGGDFFDTGIMDSSADQQTSVFAELPEWPEDERLRAEKDTLGLYLTGHPIDQYLDELCQFTTHQLSELNADKKQNIVVAGLIIALRTMKTKRGDKMVFFTIDDRSGRQEIALFAEKFESFRELLITDTIVVLSGELGMDYYSGNARINVDIMYDLDGARNRFAKRLEILVNHQQINNEFIQQFKTLIEPFREGGECPLNYRYTGEQARAVIILADQWRVTLSQELLDRLETLTHTPCKVVYR